MDLREKSFADTVRDIAAEGVVLLENNGVLPLTEDRKRIALYGAGAVLTRKGGTGSGDVSVEHVTNIVEALEEAHYFLIKPHLLRRYPAPYRQRIFPLNPFRKPPLYLKIPFR